MKRGVCLFHFSETTMFIIFLATSAILIPLLNQNQIAIAQQLQGLQDNQTSSSSSPTKQQQPTGISFEIDNMTFSHHTDSVNGIQLHYVIGGHGDYSNNGILMIYLLSVLFIV